MPVAALELRDGAVAIGGRPVLRHVDLTVPEGQFVALMGANGSGKSTLVRAALGLWPLAQGSVHIYGTPLRRFDDWSRIGFVPQRGAATSGVPSSVHEVVASGRLSRRRLLRPLSREDRRAIAEALEVVGMTDRAKDRSGQLSGGQQQRVLIARALAGGADLLLLDEPTAGVDLANQRALAESLGRVKAAGATVLLVAHELGPLAPLVDRAVVMRHGRIAYDGEPLGDHAGHDTTYGDTHSHHHPAEDIDDRADAVAPLSFPSPEDPR
ncbi:metal ABC transporter ATP-binding protein [uncultured Nocardioides sp.]|uniref:metal ABC transporter ATP-binding protein n=1 Tax=uncultured Nocardioides sp. TaxID=198441 RepID=UPI002619B8EE|nr:metal ABC transporter ATP-binding protein [uncultured Nocardioides sp.]